MIKEKHCGMAASVRSPFLRHGFVDVDVMPVPERRLGVNENRDPLFWDLNASCRSRSFTCETCDEKLSLCCL